MVDGVGNAGVLGHALVGEVDFAVLVDGNVFEEGVACDGVVDVGFAFLVEVNNLGIAAAFEVEHALVVPAVFVVADEETFGVGGKGGLACTAEAEEDGGVLAVHVGVGRAVHRGDAFQGQVVVHHREHTFLHFTAVPGVDDNLFARGEVEDNGCLAVEAEFLVVGQFGLGGVVDDEVGLEVLEVLGGGADEHIGHEVSLPCHFHDEADGHAGVLVCAAETVDNEEGLVREFFDCEFLACFPGLFGSGLVIVLVFFGCPPDGVLGCFVEYDEFVFGRAAGVNAGHHVYCAEFCDDAFLVAFQGGEGLEFEQFVVTGVVEYFLDVLDAVLLEVGFYLRCAGCFDFFDIAHSALRNKRV